MRVRIALDALKRAWGWVAAAVGFIALAALLGHKVVVLWEIEDHLMAIRSDIRASVVADSVFRAKDARMDYELRDYMCKQMGLRNTECPHFEGRVVILVEAGAVASVDE